VIKNEKKKPFILVIVQIQYCEFSLRLSWLLDFFGLELVLLNKWCRTFFFYKGDMPLG